MLNKDERNKCYEQIVHDQALYSAVEALNCHRQLSHQLRLSDSPERRRKAKQIEERLGSLTNKCYMLSYMYEAAGRDDLRDIMLRLSSLVCSEAATGMIDPEGWKEACLIGGHSPNVNHEIPDNELRQWRLAFLDAIQNGFNA